MPNLLVKVTHRGGSCHIDTSKMSILGYPQEVLIKSTKWFIITTKVDHYQIEAVIDGLDRKFKFNTVESALSAHNNLLCIKETEYE